MLQPGLIKGPWSKQEDSIIITCIKNNITKWSDIAGCLPGRSGKQCRDRWVNHLNPDINKSAWTDRDDALLRKLQLKYGMCV